MQVGSPSDELERGRHAYARGEYGRAVAILRPLLYPEVRLESENELVHAHRMLGVAYLFENEEEQAGREFRRLLQLRPDFRFDPLLDPPQIVDFFNEVVREQGEELARLQSKRRALEVERQGEQAELQRLRAGPTVVQRRVVRNSFSLNFLPFGTGQFQNGHRRKGWAFLTTQSVLGAVSVGALSTNFALYGVRPRRRCLTGTPPEGAVLGGCPEGYIDNTDENRSKRLTRVQVVSGGLFFASVAWGIIDAVVHWEPEMVLPDSPVPRAAQGADDEGSRTSPSPARSSLTWVPVVLGSSIGPGLAFRF